MSSKRDSTMSESDKKSGYTYSTVAYSDDSHLNNIETCVPRGAPDKDKDRFWIIYIHGGAWRDPAIKASSFNQIRDKLLDSPVNDKICGYASINYRLSPYPSHPTDPSDPSDPSRNSRHPDHINDVLAAILWLQEFYDFEDRYILVGHSCGATLALQVAMKRYWGSQYESTFALELNVVPPRAIVGLEGIYDITSLIQDHLDQPIYQDFIHNAFGMEWKSVSPTNGDYDITWADGKLVVLAHSPNDSLVNERQVSLMKFALEMQQFQLEGERSVRIFELTGDHDEVWQTGEASKAIEWAVAELSKLS